MSFNSAATGKTKSCYMKSKQEGYSKINVAIWGARMVDAEGKFVVLTVSLRFALRRSKIAYIFMSPSTHTSCIEAY